MNIIQQFIKSIYSPSSISKFRYQKIGRGIIYIFFLMFITILPIAILLGTGFSSFFNETGEHLKHSFPEFTIEKGVLQSNALEPIIKEDENVTLIFDSTGEFSPDSLSLYNDAFALLEKEVIIYANGVRESFTYGEIDLSKQEIVEFYESILGIAPLLISLLFIFMYLFATGMKFIGVTFLSLVGFLMTRKTGSEMNFKQCWMIAAYTVTLPTLLFAVIDLLQADVPFSFTIYWMIAFIMLYNVMKEIHSQKEASN